MSEDFVKPCIELGFIEKTETWKLTSKFFPSKVGGRPSWLALECLPTNEDLQCRKCQKPLIFLCQIYAPVTTEEKCFHRTIFVFICRDGKCSSENDASNIKVFRCQLPRKNKYYSFMPTSETEKDGEKNSHKPCASDFVKLCRVCGSLGAKGCANCKMVTYCSRDHQALDWKAGHKWECNKKELASPLSMSSKDVLFPEYEIDLEPEEIEVKEKTEEEVITEYENLLRKGQRPNEETEEELDEKDLIKVAAKEADKQFARFRTRISQYPDQVLRYERGSKPLYVSSENQPKEVPPCERCGEESVFEFQIMPQLLVHLKVDSPGQSIDWGTVLIYTCKKSCSPEDTMYVQDMAFKQDYTPTSNFLMQ